MELNPQPVPASSPGEHPAGAIHIVQGEISCILTEIKRTWLPVGYNLYTSTNPLINNFVQLKETLYAANDLSEITASTFLSPFLELIRSEVTSGHLTGLALVSVGKFLSYSLIDTSDGASCSVAVENIADAITHARFVGNDPESDEVVLMRLLCVLRTLMLSKAGRFLTNESICEIMQSCFRICFENRLSQLLRKTSNPILVEMVQLLFLRLPEFEEDRRWEKSSRKLKMRTGGLSSSTHTDNDRSRESSINIDSDSPTLESLDHTNTTSTEHDSPTTTPAEDGLDPSTEREVENENIEADNLNSGGSIEEKSEEDNRSEVKEHMVDIHQGYPDIRVSDVDETGGDDSPATESSDEDEASSDADGEHFVNNKGVRFIPKKDGPPTPYGLPAIRELFRFLISIINPVDRQNNEEMSYMGINLLTVAVELSSYYLPKYSSLMYLVKNELCFNLFRQLQTEKLTVFVAAIRLCFMIFESMRSHLKYQLEMYLMKLMEIIVSENVRPANKNEFEILDIKEAALQGLVQLWRIPGLVTELFVNYDCDVHCSNLFDDITKLLSKNAFPVSGLMNTHILSLDALLTVLESVEVYCHSRVMASKHNVDDDTKSVTQVSLSKKIKQNRLAGAETELPTLDQLHSTKQKKQILQQGIDLFNQKHKSGIAYLQEQGYLTRNTETIVKFLKETERLNKAMIGEYISRKDIPNLTHTFFSSFDFRGKRVDEALRMILETFRLPGEAPVIGYLLEIFSSLWHESNGEPFANDDAAYTLIYAVIMLNVDQHNLNAKKQNVPMKVEDFKRMLKKVNGGEDYDQTMLENIFNAIQEREIVLPEEQTGLLREEYLWKVLLGKGEGSDARFIHTPAGYYDSEIFSIIWGPTIAALSYVFDKSHEPIILDKAILGFKKCAMISAHYGLSEVFDNLVISLCKFTGFLNTSLSPQLVPVIFSQNVKIQLATKTVFHLAHQHGDILREGWKNILDCLLTLFKSNLLPNTFTEVTDFLQPDGRIKIITEDKSTDNKADGGILSFFSYFGSNDQTSQKTAQSEDKLALDKSRQIIEECDLDSVIDDTKFMRTSSLQELVKALISLSQFHYNNAESCRDESTVVFFLELLLRVVLQNRDRAGVVWQSVKDHLSYLISEVSDHTLLAERAVTGLLRLAERLLRREEVSTQVLPSLKTLLLMKSSVLRSMSRQISFGLHHLLVQNAANIHSTDDWKVLFTLLEVVGAGAAVPPYMLAQGEDDSGQSTGSPVLRSDSPTVVERGYTSDSELYHSSSTNAGPSRHHSTSQTDISTYSTAQTGERSVYTSAQSAEIPELSGSHDHNTWVLVNKKTTPSPTPTQSSEQINVQSDNNKKVNQFSISLNEQLYPHDTKALMKCGEILDLLVKDAAHITPFNFDSCVHTIRIFVEASMYSKNASVSVSKPNQPVKKKRFGRKDASGKVTRSQSDLTHPHGEDDSENSGERIKIEYHQLSTQILTLILTLHTRAANIFHSWAKESIVEHSVSVKEVSVNDTTSQLWNNCWCPLLQAIAYLCTDERRSIRSYALTQLQRALLAQDLNELSALEWESCFNKVLFPLLSSLLHCPGSSTIDDIGLEETRCRASTLLSKVYLQHLHLLQELPTFAALWLTILDVMRNYMSADKNEQLSESIPETLKNMLLVMSTPGMNLFYDQSSTITQLCFMTCDELNKFLPALRQELFPDPEPQAEQPDLQQSIKTTPEPAVNITSDPVNLPVLTPPEPTTPNSSFTVSNVTLRSNSPETVHRPTSPFVQPVTNYSPKVQLHPPLEVTKPQLLPVTDLPTMPITEIPTIPVTDLPSAASLFTQTQNNQ